MFDLSLTAKALKKINQLKPDVMGVNINLQIFPYSSSAGRLYMMGNHVSKSVVTIGRSMRRILCGFERQYGKKARNIIAPANMRVERVIYRKSIDNPGIADDWTEIHVIFFNEEKQCFDVLHLPRYFAQNTYIAFEYKYDKAMLRRLIPGGTFGKGEVFANSPRVSNTGEWMFGMDTMVAGMSDYSTEEDGVTITESYAKRLGCVFAHHREFGWNDSEYIPLNLYGDENEYCPFPKPGQKIRPDGIVIGFRKRVSEYALTTLTAKALREPDFTYDELIFADPSCVCQAVNVRTERYKKRANNRSAAKASQEHTKMLEQYESSGNRAALDAQEWFYRNRDRYNMSGDSLSPSLFNYIFKSMGDVSKDTERDKFTEFRRSYKATPLKDWNIEITLREHVTGKVRFKVADTQGGKSVIVKIIPDHWAPRDDYGRCSELIANNTPAFRRQIFSLLLEQCVNFINHHVYDQVKCILDNNGTVADAWDTLWKFYSTVSPEYAALLEEADFCNDKQLQEDHVWYVYKNFISVFKRSDSELYGVDIVRELRKIYKFKPTPVTFINEMGETVRTERPVIITSVYYMLLDKFGTDMSTQSFPRLSAFGTPAKLSKNQRYRTPNRDAPNRNTGETESRTEVSQTGGYNTVKLLAGANSPVVFGRMIRRIIRADNPFNIKQIIRPDEIKTNRSVQLGMAALTDSGYTVRKETENDRM